MAQQIKYRLSSSTLIEPLINHWPAWSQLVPPVPASMHLLNYQMKLMQSYLEDPEAHVNACRHPELIGGPYIDVPVERANEIRQLMERTQKKQSANIELAKSIVEFHNWLVDEARGESLKPYYHKLPEPMRGYVELIYDYYNRPSVRFLEGMLYESKYYDRALQSIRLSRLTSDASRQFFMSTPRLPNGHDVHWEMPFNEDAVDDLFKLDIEPQPLGAIAELLGIEGAGVTRLLPLLTDEPAAFADKWIEPTVRIRYLGHASVLVEWNGASIIIDPLVSPVPSDGGVSRLSYSDLPKKIDYALVTHVHQDHFVLETLLRLRNRIGCLVVPKAYGILYGDASLKLIVQKLGFKNVIELDTLESISLPDGEIIAAPFLGEHGDLSQAKIAYVVRAGREKIMFGADCDCLDWRMYENLRRAIGPIENLFLGLECVGAPVSWSCGTLLPKKLQHSHDQSRRQHGCDSARALEIIDAIGAKRVFNYAMGLEPWIEHILGLGLTDDSTQIKESNRLLAKAYARGLISAERPFARRDIYISNDAARNRSFVAVDSDKHRRVIISQRKDRDHSPLSAAQEQLWALSRLDQDGHIYNVSASVRFAQRLDVKTLKQSFDELVKRHEILRASFFSKRGQPAQAILADAATSIDVHDLSSLAEPERDAELRRRFEQQATRPFDLSASPLLRASLIRSAEDDALFLTAHRIIADQESMQLMIDQLLTIYDCFSTGKSLPPAQQVSYIDYAAWQRQWLQTEAIASQLEYWKKELSQPCEPVCLPTDSPRSEATRFRVARQPISPDPSLSDSLEELGNREGCSLLVILLAAFKALLHRYTGQLEITLVMVNNNRRLPGTELLIGPFSNRLVLRTDLSGDPTFTALLSRVKNVVSRAQENQDVIFERLENLKAERWANGARPSHIMFASDISPDLTTRHSACRPVEVTAETGNCDITFSLAGDEKSASWLLEYNAELFESDTVAVMAEHLKTLLQGVAANPDEHILDIPLTGDDSDTEFENVASGVRASDAQDQFLF